MGMRLPYWVVLVCLGSGLLTGCAGVQDKVEDARAAVTVLGVALDRSRDFVLAACKDPPIMPAERCAAAVSDFNDLQSAYQALRKALP